MNVKCFNSYFNFLIKIKLKHVSAEVKWLFEKKFNIIGKQNS